MAQIGRSPIAVQRWGRPSVPATRSWHARTFTRSDKCLLLRAEFRRTRVAAIARAHVAKGADIRPRGIGRHAAASALDVGAGVVLGDK
eukprot:3735056-Pleurochrysis_carterae.AAC.1